MAQKEITEFQQITTVVSDDELLIFDKDIGTTKKVTAEQILAEPSAHAADTANPHAVTNSQVGLGNVTDDEQLKRAANLSDIPDPATARTNLGVASSGDMSSHIADTGNPHAVTKAQVGLGNVTNDQQLASANNLSDVGDTATARTNLSVPSQADHDAHLADSSNPHLVDNNDVGLSNVTDDAQLKAASNLSDLADVATARTNLSVPSQSDHDAHLADVLNPHIVTKDQVGLSNITNDAQLKINSNLLDIGDAATARSNIGAAAQTSLDSHTGDGANPHSVSKTQVSLGNVTNDAQLKIAGNLSDVADPATARGNIGAAADADLTAHTGNTNNPHSVTRDQLGVKHTNDWYIAGALSVATEQGGVWIAPRVLTIEKTYIYCKTPGTVGSTIVDINLNGTTIFNTQANRPELAWDDADNKAVSGTPDVTALVEGDIISIDVDQIATGAENLSIILICH